MKRKIIYTIAFLYACLQIFAQAPQGIQYQVVVRDDNNELIQHQQVSLVVEVLQGSTTGSVIFSETHTVTTSKNGMAIFSIGSLENGTGTLDDIKWGDEDYFLQVSLDSRIVDINRILVTPFVKYSNTANTVNHLEYNQLSNVPDLTNFDEDVSDDFSGDYNDLSNKPTSYFDGDYNSLTGDIPTRYITQEESNKIDSIIVTDTINFEELEAENITTRSLIGTPDFGNKEGTIVEGNTAWKAVEGNMIHPGSVGVNVPIPSDFGGAGMMVNGAVLYDGVPVTPTPGMLFYDPDINDGSFCFYNENGEVDTLSTGVIEGGGVKNKGYKQIFDDFEVSKSLVVGKGATIEHNKADHTMVVVGNVILLKFDDTSTSASFPKNDWQIKTNDIEAGGDDFFAFVDFTANQIPFRIDAGAEDNTLYIPENGNVGIGTNTPSEKLEVNGSVKAASYSGSGKQLTGIDYEGTGSVDNSGSTTIIADNDANNVGQIEFKINDANQMVINNSGKVGIGVENPTVELEVNGTGASENLIVEGTVYSAGISYPVHKETITSTGYVFYDVTDKSVIILNPSVGTINLYITMGATVGKEIVVINENATNIINSIGVITPEAASFSLGQYESARLLYTSSGWVATQLVQAP